jgi:hypothetical protein
LLESLLSSRTLSSVPAGIIAVFVPADLRAAVRRLV